MKPRASKRRVPGDGKTVEKRIRSTRAVNQFVRAVFGRIGYQLLFFCPLANINGADCLDQVFLYVDDLVAVATLSSGWSLLVQIVDRRCDSRLAGLFAQWRRQSSHGA